MAEALDELEWTPSGFPKEESINRITFDAFKRWFRRRLEGRDGHWSLHDGDEPEELIRVLARTVATDSAREKIGFALRDLLVEILNSRDERSDLLLTLLDLAPIFATVPASHVTSSIRDVLDNALDLIDDESPVDRTRALLIARAAMGGIVPKHLWEKHLTSKALSIAAFQCAVSYSLDEARDAISILLQLHNPHDSALLVQFRLFQEIYDTQETVKLLQQLSGQGEKIGPPAQTVQASLGFATQEWPQETSQVVTYKYQLSQLKGWSLQTLLTQRLNDREDYSIKVQRSPLVFSR